MRILICTYVLGYQCRYWWQLSSLLEQTPCDGWDVPYIDAMASVSRRDKHFTWNNKLAISFGLSQWKEHWGGVQFDEWHRDDEKFGRRGHVRSKNLQYALEHDYDWILFNDGDMVYHPEFFADLNRIVHEESSDQMPLIKEGRVLATYRDSMKFEDGYKLVRGADYTKPIENPFEAAMQVPTWPAARHRISGAGFFQLVNLEVLRRRVFENPDLRYYVDPSYNKDHNTFEQNHITRSDRNFRMRLGGIAPIHCKPQIHLNHFRKNDPEIPDEVH